MGRKLKTKIEFRFDAETLEDEVPEINFEVNMKTNSQNKPINIVEIVDIKKVKTKDASTKLF